MCIFCASTTGHSSRKPTRCNGWALRISLVASHRRLHRLVHQRLLVQSRLLPDAGVLPGANEQEVLVVALGLAVGVLVLLAEVAAARLVPLQGIEAQEFGELQV